MIKRFCWGSVSVKGNVTELTHLVLVNSHPAQKDGPETLFLIYCTSKHHFVLSSVGNQLKWWFTIFIKNKHKEEDGSLTDDDQALLNGATCTAY